MEEITLPNLNCENCGAELPQALTDDGGFCPQCGTSQGPALSKPPGEENADRAELIPSPVGAFFPDFGGAPPEPVQDPDHPTWGPLAGVGVWMASFAAIIIVPLVAVFLFYVIGQVSGGSMPATRQEVAAWLESPPIILVQVVSTIAAHALTLVICWAVVTQMGRRPFWSSLGWQWPGRSASYKALFVAGVVVGVYVMNGALAQLLPQAEETLFDRMLKSSREVRISVALLAVLSAPLVEEVVYRGVLYSGLRRKIGVMPSVLAVTMLFAGVHFVQYWGAWASLTGLTILSFVLTMIRAKTRSLFPCFAVHLIFNMIGATFIVLRK